MSIWDNETIVDDLKSQWADRRSCSAIANDLSATYGVWITRNAVIGKIHRLGLNESVPRPPSGNTMPRVKLQRTPKDVNRDNRTRERLKRKPVLLKAIEPIRDIPPGRVALVDLKSGQCKFPSGTGPYLFCGSPQVDGLPYCAGHARLCYQTSYELSKERQAAREASAKEVRGLEAIKRAGSIGIVRNRSVAITEIALSQHVPPTVILQGDAA